jgi:hypothetical protein
LEGRILSHLPNDVFLPMTQLSQLNLHARKFM